MVHEASCSCGQLTVTCRDAPTSVSLCHCRACQRRTGGPFGIAAFFPRDAVTAKGRWRTFRRGSDAGFALDFHFCDTCGSTVFWEPSRLPDLIAVGVGFFGDPDFPKPTAEYHTECRHAWVSPLPAPEV